MLTVITESNAKIMSIGVHKIPVKMERLAFNRKMSLDVTVLLDGLAKCAMLKWSRAKMQR